MLGHGTHPFVTQFDAKLHGMVLLIRASLYWLVLALWDDVASPDVCSYADRDMPQESY